MAERIDTDELVAVFQGAWATADDEGNEGHRTEAGIAAVLEHLLLMDDDIVIGEPYARQGLTIWLGDGLPVTVGDDTTRGDLRDLITSPLQREVTRVRLSFVFDALGDKAGEE